MHTILQMFEEFLRLVNVDLEKAFYAALDGYLPKLVLLLQQRSGQASRRIQDEAVMFEEAKV